MSKPVKDAANGNVKRLLTEEELKYGFEVGKLALGLATKEQQTDYFVAREEAYQKIIQPLVEAGYSVPSRKILSGEEEQ